METISNFMLSPTFKSVASGFAIISVLLAVILLLASIAFYLRHPAQNPKLRELSSQSIIIGTLFDIFILNIIYVVLDLLRGALQYRNTEQLFGAFVDWLLILAPFVELALFLLITVIAIKRLKILSQWLGKET